MKLIDAIKKVLDGELSFETPCKMLFKNDIAPTEYESIRQLFSYANTLEDFDREIEIIEEKSKELSEIQIENDSPTHFYVRDGNGTKCGLTKHSKIIAEKVNELVKAVNYLLDKDNNG